MIHVGTDIIEIERIKNAVNKRAAFCDRVLTDREKEYYMVKKDPFPFLAGRFAAKEAIIKCLGCGMRGLSWRDMEIIPDEMGAPQVFFTQNIEKILSKKGLSRINVSISHSRDYAVAVAIGE